MFACLFVCLRSLSKALFLLCARSAYCVAIVLFCENVGIDEYFLCAMPSFWQNVGIEYIFTLAMQSFCDKCVICV